MAQHDYVIANDTAANVRADINSALAAIVSNNSGGTEPTTTYANQWWFDTATNILKLRTNSNDAWMSVAYLDDTANAFRILDDTQVVNTSGTQTGLIGDQAQATWEAGTGTTESLVSPAKVKSAITALALTNSPFVGTPVEDVYAISGTSVALEPDNGSVQTHTLTGNTTYTDAFSAGQAITLMIDDGTAYTITWPTMTWVNNAGAAPTLATTGYTVVALWKVSTTLYGALVGDGS